MALLLDSHSPGVYDAAITQYKTMVGYLKWENMGIITIHGMETRDTMKTHVDLEKVYELGKQL